MRAGILALAASVAVASAVPLEAGKPFLQVRQAASSVVGTASASAASASAAPSASASSAAAASASSSGSSAAAAQPSATAASLATNMANTTGVTDLDVLQFALFLEQLEINFYLQGLSFSDSDYSNAGYPSWVRERFTEIVSQENTHIATISQAITAAGGTPAAKCTYDFGNPGLMDYFVMADSISNVGPAAYTGSAAAISSKPLLTIAAQILAVEARHNAWFRSDVTMKDAFPQTFEVPLSPGQAYTVASQFVVSCPSNNTKLVVTSAPALNITPVATQYYAGQTITLKKGVALGPANGVGNATYTPATAPAPQSFNQTGLYAAFLDGTPGQSMYPIVALGSDGSVTVPQNVTGQSYVVVVNSASTISDATTVAGPAPIIVPVPNSNFPYSNSTNV